MTVALQDHSVAVPIRPAMRADLPRIAELYRKAFPEAFKSRLGLRVCLRWFAEHIDDDAYQLIAAVLDDRIVGFSLLQIDMSAPRSKTWVLHSWPYALRYLARHPQIVLEHLPSLAAAVRRRVGLRKRAGATVATPQSEPVRFGYIETIAVCSESRGRGVGKALIANSIGVIQRETLGQLKLNVDSNNTPAIRLYESMGFVRTGESKARSRLYYTYDCRPHDSE